MNLWAKRTGQFLLAALFLMSCEDDTFLLGFKNQNQKFKVRYQEFTLPSSVVLIDTLITDNHDYNAVTRLLVGEYQDAQFGTVRSEAYSQYFPSVPTKIQDGSVYDSVTVQLRLDLYSYGFTGISQQKINVHELSDTLSVYQRYYSNVYNSVQYQPVSLGEKSFEIDYDDIQKSKALGEAMYVNIKLDDEFGYRLFFRSLTDMDSTEVVNFKKTYKGLAFIPTQSNMLIGYSAYSTDSKIIVHYHTSTADSLERAFYFNPLNSLSLNKITVARTGDLASVTQSYEAYEPASGKRYIQSGSYVATRVDLSEFYDFITDPTDSLKNIVINSAEISIESIENSSDETPPPPSLALRVMTKSPENRDVFSNTALDEDSIALAGYYLANEGKYYLTAGDILSSTPQPTTLSYSSTKNNYSGFMTLFIQNLIDRKSFEKVRYLGIIPQGGVEWVPEKGVDRVIFGQDKIKLKIYYTSPVEPNL